jgi:hypothetical protein
MADVIDTWLTNGPSGFPAAIQDILATQNPTTAAAVGIVRSDAYDRAVLNALNTALGG